MFRPIPLIKTAFAAALATLAALPAQAAPAQSLQSPQSQLIPNQYIVVIDKSALPRSLAKLGIADVAASTLSLVGGGAVGSKFETALTGFAARLSPNQAAALAKLSWVKLVEQDSVVSLEATQPNPPSYGLDRIDQRALPLGGSYIYPNQAGAGTHIYVLDTGINPNHTDFTNRIGTGRNFSPNTDGVIGDLLLPVSNLGLVPVSLGALDFGTGLFAGNTDPTNTTDCNGHGTHVSGTAMGTTFGVAKAATVHPIRVFSCAGSTATSTIIAGVDWVSANRILPAVANMSLGGGDSAALDQAVLGMINRGVTTVVAAGNSTADACSGSPNKIPRAVTVGATDRNDAQASYSNFGSCLDIYAPGSNIPSASFDSNTGTLVLSGTSMASPHVAGAAALVLGAIPSLSPDAVRDELVGNATLGVITGISAGSPNALLYTGP